jgi:DNA/RNA endonuclease G (NUC1)
MDNTTLHPLCSAQAHKVELLCWRGAPRNRDPERPIQILVNHGYVVGFCPERLQPAWSAYNVADSTADVDYERPLLYYDDLRLDESHRIGRRTFGKLGGIQLNVGHMTPNEVINRQFGRLAQMETFLMSNMSPQYGSLNSGVWLKLETAIRNINDDPKREHVWIIVGPVFGQDPPSINRGQGKYLQVPESYFCIAVDPKYYPYDTPSSVHIDCFVIPQNAPGNSNPQDYPATLEEIEAATNLEFFPAWGRDQPLGLSAQGVEPYTSRLMSALEKVKVTFKAVESPLENPGLKAKTIEGLIDALKQEAAQVQIAGRALTVEEQTKLKTIEHTISWLLLAANLGAKNPKPSTAQNLITYKIEDDLGDKLLVGARTSCNFWNRFVEPQFSIVIRLGIFTSTGNTIARAYKPYENNSVRYGKVEFNTKYLGQFDTDEIAGTIIHEIGHSLGIGWDEWDKLYSAETGKFKSTATKKLAALQHMRVELEGGPGTALSHWDEDQFDKELMTGYQDSGEHVLPVTIDLMSVLGHKVIERLPVRTDLKELLRDAANTVFSRQDDARQIDVDYFEKTELMETIPHGVEQMGAAT